MDDAATDLAVFADLAKIALQIDGVEMKFRYKDYFKAEPSTGYETLIYDCMIGDATPSSNPNTKVLPSEDVDVSAFDKGPNRLAPFKDEAGTWHELRALYRLVASAVGQDQRAGADLVVVQIELLWEDLHLRVAKVSDEPEEEGSRVLNLHPVLVKDPDMPSLGL